VAVLDVLNVDAKLLSLSVFADKTLLSVDVELIVRLLCYLTALNKLESQHTWRIDGQLTIVVSLSGINTPFGVIFDCYSSFLSGFSLYRERAEPWSTAYSKSSL
jgi:hypothetical protein